MFSHLPQTSTTPLLAHHTPWKLSQRHKLVFQVPVQVLKEFLSWNNSVLFQDAQDPWEDFQSLLHTENSHYTVTDPDPPTTSAPKKMTNADEEAYLQAEAYLDHKQIRRAKHQYEKETGDVSPSRYPSTP